jgi:hypothetical protein
LNFLSLSLPNRRSKLFPHDAAVIEEIANGAVCPGSGWVERISIRQPPTRFDRR